MTTKINLMARRKARRLLVQALYQWKITQQDISIIEAQSLTRPENGDLKKIDVAYFQEVLRAISQQSTALDQEMEAFLDRKLNEIDPVELSILRLAIYELAHRLDIPYRVVINEALELAKTFGSQDSHKYVNGILDKIAKRLRTIETQAC